MKRIMVNNENILELCEKRSIFINTDKVNCCGKYNLDIILKCHRRVIIKGTVYNSNELPSIGAAIEIIRVNCSSNVRETIGYAYTDNKGEYLFSLEVLPDVFYEMNIYSPLNM